MQLCYRTLTFNGAPSRQTALSATHVFGTAQTTFSVVKMSVTHIAIQCLNYDVETLWFQSNIS